MTVAPSALPNALAEVLVALGKAKDVAVPEAFASVDPSPAAQQIAASLLSGERVAVMLGNMAVASGQASLIAANAAALAKAVGAKFGFLTPGANTVGGYLAGAIPGQGGLTAEQMLSQPLKAYLVLHAEPALDSDNGARALESLKGSGFAVALTSFKSAAQDWADVMLPISPFTETSGTFVNAEGRAQSFKGAAAPFADTRPGWKVLRVLGNLFQLQGFDDETSESVRDTVMVGGIDGRLSNDITVDIGLAAAPQGLERVADVPIYRSDALVRRSQPLQETSASQSPRARMSASTLAGLGLESGDAVRIGSEQGQATLAALLDDTVAQGCVRIATAFNETLALGSGFGQLTVERA
jgi:NADH-quinone oxidoreductase subunit G